MYSIFCWLFTRSHRRNTMLLRSFAITIAATTTFIRVTSLLSWYCWDYFQQGYGLSHNKLWELESLANSICVPSQMLWPQDTMKYCSIYSQIVSEISQIRWSLSTKKLYHHHPSATSGLIFNIIRSDDLATTISMHYLSPVEEEVAIETASTFIFIKMTISSH